MPLPLIKTWAPGDAFLHATFADIAGLSGPRTVSFTAPFRGFVRLIMICPSNVPNANTTFTLTCVPNSAIVAATSGLVLPNATLERGFIAVQFNFGQAGNSFEKGAHIKITGNAESSVAGAASCDIVIGRA